MGGIFRKFDSLDQVHDLLLAPAMSKRKILDAAWFNWKSDEEFARQQVNGTRPWGVQRVETALPEYYSVTEEDVAGVLPEGKTLASEIEAKRLFMVDNSILDPYVDRCGKSLLTKKPFYVTSPLLVLHCNDDGILMPIAIQLFVTKPKEEKIPVFTPKDDPNEWLLAKMFVNNASSHPQQLIEHLGHCHLVTEPFAVATRRRLARNHPIFKLLHHHLQTVVTINSHGRQSMISPNGTVDYVMSLGGGTHVEIIREGFQNWHVSNFDIPRRIKERGMDDPNMIKEFAYREDGLKYWAAIDKYVSGILNIHYKTDEDLKNDEEIQAWMKEAKKNGFSYCKDSGLPDELTNVSELKFILQGLIFTSSVQHAADGNAMFDTFGNPASHPFSMSRPAPKTKGGDGADKVTMNRIMETLGDQDQMCLQIDISHTVSAKPEGEIFIGQFPMKLFNDPEEVKILEEFSAEIETIGIEIDERNKNWRVPYEYLHPENVACRINM